MKLPLTLHRPVLLVVLLVFVYGMAQALEAIPSLTRRVTDLTQTLDSAALQSLEQRLAQFETAHGSQIAVLMVPTTGEEEIAAYSLRVAEQWRLGRKGIDDGILLLLAKNDRRLRIEVGYGLEGVIPDAVAKRIIAETIVPRLRQGDFAGGVSAGVEQLIKIIDGESLPPPPEKSRKKSSRGGQDGLFFGILIGSLFAALGLASFIGRPLGGLLAGIGGGALLWVKYSLFMAAAGAGIVFVLAQLVGRHGSGWSSGTGFSFGGGGGFSGGGFSGGGGDFGGGGASGSW